MSATQPVARRLVAMGGGSVGEGTLHPLTTDYLLSLVPDSRRVCFVPTASADDQFAVTGFFDAFAGRCEATWLPLFGRRDADLRARVLEQDLVLVWGGNTANMLAIWRTHGLDTILREAWQAGVVLAGMSAGAICWFEASVTNSFGPGLAPLRDGVGLLEGSCCPHYDSEPLRRPTYRQLIGSGFPAGYARGRRRRARVLWQRPAGGGGLDSRGPGIPCRARSRRGPGDRAADPLSGFLKAPSLALMPGPDDPHRVGALDRDALAAPRLDRRTPTWRHETGRHV